MIRVILNESTLDVKRGGFCGTRERQKVGVNLQKSTKRKKLFENGDTTGFSRVVLQL